MGMVCSWSGERDHWERPSISKLNVCAGCVLMNGLVKFLMQTSHRFGGLWAFLTVLLKSISWALWQNWAPRLLSALMPDPSGTCCRLGTQLTPKCCSHLWAGRGAGHCKAQWSSSLKDAVCRHEVSHAALRADWWLQPMACRFLRLCKWQQPHGEQQTADVLLLGGFNFRGKLLVCNF